LSFLGEKAHLQEALKKLDIIGA